MASVPWRPILDKTISKNRGEVTSRWFQLATIAAGRPVVRSVVFRGWFSKTLSQRGADWLTIITDRRSEKVQQVQSNPFAEVCWYFPVSREQWRIAGQLTIIGNDVRINADHLGLSDEVLENARQEAWKSMSDAARAQFKWPSPGQPRPGSVESGSDSHLFASELPLKLKTEKSAEEKRPQSEANGASRSEVAELESVVEHVSVSSSSSADAEQQAEELAESLAIGYSNFCLVILAPDSIDRLSLKQQPTQRRWKYTLNGSGDDATWSDAVEVNP